MEKNTKLDKATWAISENWILKSKTGKFPIQMSSSDWTALPLVFLKETSFWADLIRYEEGKWIDLHTHEGDHILLVTSGEGILTYWKDTYQMEAWMIYTIPGKVPHAIKAKTELVVISVWNKHVHAESTDRLKIVK